MNKTNVKVNKPLDLVYLSQTLAIFEIVMLDNCYDYAKSQHREKVKPCYMDTNRFVAHIKSVNVFAYLSKDIENKFNTLNYKYH